MSLEVICLTTMGTSNVDLAIRGLLYKDPAKAELNLII